MGLTRRPKPSRLAEKLLQIRTALGLSQNGMLRQLGLAESSFRSTVSGYERGEREPPLPILLRYAEISNVYVDVLIDDRLDLPEKLPASKKHSGVRTAKK
jgi:transcriptional regulator with XRE-family HTH domain